MVISQPNTTIKSVNPATAEVIGEVPVLSQAGVHEAVQSAWTAFETWQLTNFNKRTRHVLQLRRLIERQADEIAQLVSTEVGKPLPEAYLSELTGPLDMCVWLAENAERNLRDQVLQLTNPLLSTKQSVIAFEPLGVVGIIAPWNYPFAIPMMTALMAVMVGNTVVLKPSEKSPLIGIKIGELFEKAGFPKGVVTVITGDRTTGEYLSRSRLSKLLFTGSVEGGVKVLGQCAPNLTPVSLELGGKDAAIVLPDAPLDWTARGLVWGAFTNAGQACASIERVYIVRTKKTEQLIERIVQHTLKLKVGAATDKTVDIGPVIDETQLNKIVQQVEEARSMGATIRCGGKRREDLPGYFYEPTVLTEVNHNMSIMKDETFGPVMPIMVVDSEDEAVELANDSEFGLTASVWGRGLSRAEAVARDLNVGSVFINDCLVGHAFPQAPWGGLKKSGFGRTHSNFGLIDLVNIKHISIDGAGGSHRLWWHPYGPTRVQVARGGLKFLHGSLFGKIKGMFLFIGNLFSPVKK